jgi:dnd system-associated protein 4
VIHVGPWKEEVFSNAGYEAVVNAIAATSSGELEIFAADRLPERLAVFEEFANGGLAELQKEMRVGTNALDAVRSLMMEAQVLADEKKAPDIQKIARDLSW